MAIATVCQEGMHRILASYFDNTLSDDGYFSYVLYTDSNPIATTNTHSTHTALSNTYYGGSEIVFDTTTQDVASITADGSGTVQYVVLPQVIFTFTQDVPTTIKAIGLLGSVDVNDATERLYFVEALTPFTPMTGDVFKYTLTIKMGNANALT